MTRSVLFKNAGRLFIATVFLPVFVMSSGLKAADKALIFPLPQKIQITPGSFALDEKITIVVPQEPASNDLFLARFLVRELSDKYSIATKILQVNDIPANGRFVLMGRFHVR